MPVTDTIHFIGTAVSCSEQSLHLNTNDSSSLCICSEIISTVHTLVEWPEFYADLNKLTVHGL